MKIQLASLLVDDQDKALKFYTEVLGFVKKTEVVIGESRWITVTSPDGPEGIQLVLEPVGFLPGETYQRSLFSAETPAIGFASDDIQDEYQRLVERGVVFRGEPKITGAVTSVLFEDTCGNLVSLYQVPGSPV